MSSGAQAQISLRGPQDAYLLATDETTFWRTSYTRHTNAAIAEIQVNFQMTPAYGANKITALLPRNGDLVSTVYLYSQIAPISYTGGVPFDIIAGNYAAYVDAFPHAMIDNIVCKIGQTDYDTHYGYYMEMMESLMAPANKLMGEQNFRYATQQMRAIQSTFTQNLWTPLKFWFCRFYEQSLPYVALYWHDITFELTTRPLTQLVQYAGAITSANVTVPAAPSMTLMVNYVYLDTPERSAFADGEFEYVFDQVQYLGPNAINLTSGQQQHNIRFNHPVQEIIWACQQTANLTNNDHFNFDGPAETGTVVGVTRASDPFLTGRITLNNNERVITLPANFFRLVQPSQSHSRNTNFDRRIFCYCFGVRPEDLLDTGSVNFSRLDNAFLQLTYSTGALAWVGNTFIYARNKNVMKVSSGMAGKKFAA